MDSILYIPFEFQDAEMIKTAMEKNILAFERIHISRRNNEICDMVVANYDIYSKIVHRFPEKYMTPEKWMELLEKDVNIKQVLPEKMRTDEYRKIIEDISNISILNQWKKQKSYFIFNDVFNIDISNKICNWQNNKTIQDIGR